LRLLRRNVGILDGCVLRDLFYVLVFNDVYDRFCRNIGGNVVLIFIGSWLGQVLLKTGIASTIFLGGWMPLHIAGLDAFNQVMDYIPGFVWFFGKTFFLVWVLMWFKWTFPRLRIDQILTLEWKYLVPIGLANLLLMVIIVVFKLHF